MTPPSSSVTPSAFVQHLTKSQLAKVLGVTSRTIQNYSNCGALPPSTIQGRDAVWTLDSLARLLIDHSTGGGVLPAKLRFLLQEHLDHLVEAGPVCTEAAAAGRTISTGYLIDEQAIADIDWRPRIYELNAEHRAASREQQSDALDHHRSSDERKQLLQLAARNRDAVAVNETRLATEFIPAHGAEQLLGARHLLTNALFTVRNPQCARIASCDATFVLPDGTTMQYEGPELRQDDGLVFSALIRIASDARPGRLVGFSAKEMCEALYGDYCGHRRSMLLATIGRLQSAKLKFRDFSVQLVGRFEFPKRGLWAVALDRDVLRLFVDGRHVWLRLDKALDYGQGIAAWLYRYVCSQTSLIPTKIERLHILTGSRGTLESFRRSLQEALARLAAGSDIQPEWFVDKHDMVHWRKPSKRSAVRLVAPQSCT